jgi:hypothetical protein
MSIDFLKCHITFLFSVLEMARVFFYLLIVAGIADFVITLAICFRQQQELGRFSNAKKSSLAASSALSK